MRPRGVIEHNALRLLYPGALSIQATPLSSSLAFFLFLMGTGCKHLTGEGLLLRASLHTQTAVFARLGK